MTGIKDKDKAIEWINDLTQFAEEQKLPMRILDGLDDCKKQLSSSGVDWNSLDDAVMELLESIEEKTGSSIVKAEDRKQEASVEQVKAQVIKMAQRCHTENIASIDSMAERKNMLIKKNFDKLGDITHTEAHLEEMKNENLYLTFFQNCKTAYERDAYEVFKDMLHSISSNYDYMLEHMKSMFTSIGGYADGIGNEKFYYEYEERRAGIDKRLQGEAETADIGGNDIISLAQKTKAAIKKIVKKAVRKRKLSAWLPLAILLCGFIVGAVVTREKNAAVIESYEAAGDGNDNDSSLIEAAKEFMEKIKENAEAANETSDKGISQDVIRTVLSAGAGLLLSLAITLGLVLIFIILLIIVCYAVYLRMLKRRCNNEICKKCGEYLTAELLQFERNNALSAKLDAAVQNAADEYEKQYMDILNNLFAGTRYGSEDAPQKEISKLSELREAWNKIKYV